MGRTTDELIALTREVTSSSRPRELDMLMSTGEAVSSALLSMALHELGSDAIGLSGPQAGIRTDAVYGRARISGIDTERIERELDAGRIVIVAGFQSPASCAPRRWATPCAPSTPPSTSIGRRGRQGKAALLCWTRGDGWRPHGSMSNRE